MGGGRQAQRQAAGKTASRSSSAEDAGERDGLRTSVSLMLLVDEVSGVLLKHSLCTGGTGSHCGHICEHRGRALPAKVFPGSGRFASWTGRESLASTSEGGRS